MSKILHVITSLDQGGAEQALFRLLKAQKSPSDHTVVSLRAGGVFRARLTSIGVQVHSLNMDPGRPSPLALFRLLAIMWRFNPSAVQTWMYHADLIGGVAARILRYPVCWGIRHSNLSVEYNKPRTLVVVRVCAFLSRWIPSITVSCSSRAALVHQEAGYRSEFIVIPNGVEVSEFSAGRARGAEVRGRLGVPIDASLVGHVGRSDPQKDHSTLIEVFRRVHAVQPEARLLLIGKGLEAGEPYFESLIRGLGCRDGVIGVGPQSDVGSYMAAMDVFVLSSRGEAFPNVVVEAMASRVPCVVTDVGDAAEIVETLGWVCRPGDAPGLADSVLAALSEPPDLRHRRVESARKRVAENYSVDAMAQRYEEVWSLAVSRRG